MRISVGFFIAGTADSVPLCHTRRLLGRFTCRVLVGGAKEGLRAVPFEGPVIHLRSTRHESDPNARLLDATAR